MQTIYKRCECCGKYFLESSDKEEKYCCVECKDEFIRCAVCGNYYILEANIDKENFVCSEECARKHEFKQQKEKDLLI